MSDQAYDLDTFFQITKDDLERKIKTTISDKTIISILEGGKRLRPLLAHLIFKVCNQGKESLSKYQKALEGGVSIELAHAASLVHDDIIDRDNERRGKSALHIEEGVDTAILKGHKLLAVGFDIALNHGDEIAKLYVDTWNDILAGELDEVAFNEQDIGDITETSTNSSIFAAYNKIIDMKTASLFSSACKAGAIEANIAGDILKVFADYGREIGLAYQLADDLVDLANGEMIDSVVIPLLNRLENKMIIKKSFTKRRIKKIANKHSSQIQQLYLDEIKSHVQKAEELSKLDIIPESPYKQLLMDAPTYIINRMLKEIHITI
jgi:geranylgeranyl pyrophosphate synthase